VVEAARTQDAPVSQLRVRAAVDPPEEEKDQGDDMSDELSGGEDLPPSSPVSSSEMVQLLGLFTSLLHQTETRILEGMRHATGQLGEDLALNSQAAKERWAKHELEHAKERQDLCERWENHIAEAERRWLIEDREEVKFDARVQPVRAAIQWMWNSRKDIIIIILGILTLLGLSATWWPAS
jgi:hypothetical protein